MAKVIDLLKLVKREQSFWSNVSPPNENGCRLWLAGRTKDGYGRFNNSRDNRLAAHRAAYALLHREDPGELEVCHTCDVPLCCEGSHLFKGTQDDNMKDMGLKGRSNTYFSPEHRMKISIAATGRVFSEAHRKNISIASTNMWARKRLEGRLAGGSMQEWMHSAGHGELDEYES